MSMNYANVAAANNAYSAANQAAQNAYNSSKLKLDSDTLAFQKAQEAWKEEMDKAGLTGMYQGQWTMPSQEYFANTFGTWGAPTAGQQTLAAQQQQFQQGQDVNQQAQTWSQLMGSYVAPGSLPTAGQQTLAGQNQAFTQGVTAAGLTGMYNNAPTLAGQQQAYNQWLQAQQLGQAQQGINQTAWQQQQQAAQNYMQMMAGLRGPADWVQYQKMLGATPGGISDLVRSAAGQYIPGGGATTGVPGQAASLNSFYNQLTGGGQPSGQYYTSYPQGGQSYPSYQQTYQYGGQQPQQGQQYQAQQQAQGAYGQTSNASQNMLDQFTGANTSGQAQGQTGYAGSDAQAAVNSLVAPNQMAPQTWNALTPSQQQMLQGVWEGQGYTQEDAKALFNQSLPKYAGPQAGGFRLQ